MDLDQLLDMSSDDLLDLFHARARRRLQRGLKRKPLALIKKLRKAKKEASGDKPAPVRTHLRNMLVMPEMIGSMIGVYNGKTFNQVGSCSGASRAYETRAPAASARGRCSGINSRVTCWMMHKQ